MLPNGRRRKNGVGTVRPALPWTFARQSLLLNKIVLIDVVLNIDRLYKWITIHNALDFGNERA